MLRVFQIALSAVATLLVVPFAVNISTGGDPPGWMRPFVGWLWPVAIACVVAVIVLEAVDRLAPAKREKVIRHRVGDPRNISLALAQVTRYVSARQQGSLAERVRIALALDERPTAVRQPAHLVARVSGDVFTLSPELGIADVFAQLNESMLILGAPGAGKTTQLLDLAEALVATGRAAERPFVPVVLDLADWIRPRHRRFTFGRSTDDEMLPLWDWIVSAMAERYLIGTEIGAEWLNDDRIVLLLDGLDEVGEEDRERCITEINNLTVTRIAVCSREADYDRLGVRLRMQGAVTIRPLTRDQVITFFATADPALAQVITGLNAADELWEVLTTPLTLSITVLAHADRDALFGTADPARRRQLLFDAYVVEVLSRRRAGGHSDPEQVLRALRVLAEAAILVDAGIRVETFNTQAAFDVLPVPAVRVAHFWVLPVQVIAVAVAVAVGITTLGDLAAIIPALVVATMVAISVPPLSAPPIKSWLALAVFVAACAVVVGFVSVAVLAAAAATAGAAPLTVAAWALGGGLALPALIWWVERRNMEGATWVIIAVAIVVGVALPASILLFGYSPEAGRGWAIGLLTMAGGFGALGATGAVPGRAWEDDTLYRRWHTFAIAGGVWIVASIPTWLLADPAGASFWAPTTGWLIGLVHGLLPAVFLSEAISVPSARAALAVAGEPMPWRRRFVRFATDRGLLTYADGEYRFVHLLVRDHLAACDPRALAVQVAHRVRELATSVPSPRDPAA